jgi:prepilin-type N-terminal cleavage/methylation domain-containing protein
MAIATAVRRTAGFTLLELLAVMAILAVLMGITVGALQRSGKAQVVDAAARVVKSQLERARHLALKNSTLSKITIIPQTNTTSAMIRGQVSRIAGSWHFDESEPAIGGDGSTLRMFGAAAAPGVVRSGLTVSPVARVQGPKLTGAPTHDPRFGFSLELNIKPEGPGVIARFGPDTGDSGSFLLRLNDDGSLAGEAAVRTVDKGLTVQTRPKVIEMGQWAKVAIAHDGVEFSIAAHNVIEARTPDLHELETDPASALVIGGFLGTVDEVIYKTVGDLDPYEIDRLVSVKLNYPLTVRFNRDGRLNERFHTEPVVIPLSHEGRTVEVTVDLSGVIR